MPTRSIAPVTTPPCTQQGFTLLEVMVSLAIFALLSAACYQFLQHLALARADILASAEQRMQLETSLLIIEQDLRHLLPRSVRRDGSASRVPALTNRLDTLLEFSRTGLPLGRSTELDAPGRVLYRLQEEGDEVGGGEGEAFSLRRTVYRALDTLDTSPAYEQLLLSGVAAVDLRFQDDQGSWRSHWPPEVREGEEPDLNGLPTAVEVSISLPASAATLQRVVSLR